MSDLFFVVGWLQVPLTGLPQFEALFAAGYARRRTGGTGMNAVSSRSHSLVVVTMSCRQGSRLLTGKLNLIDLAGQTAPPEWPHLEQVQSGCLCCALAAVLTSITLALRPAKVGCWEWNICNPNTDALSNYSGLCAGFEDNRRTGNEGERMTESTRINSSLFALHKVWPTSLRRLGLGSAVLLKVVSTIQVLVAYSRFACFGPSDKVRSL
jgi:hypothetical protein